jgi:hypothetical protein
VTGFSTDNGMFIYKTIDAGNSWHICWENMPYSLPNIQCIDENHVYLYSIDYLPYVYKTDNGGCSIVSVFEPKKTPFSISINPNPTSNELNINWTGNSPDIIRIIDYLGRQVFNNQNIKGSGNSYKINTTTLQKGLYIAELRFEESVVRKKFVVN